MGIGESDSKIELKDFYGNRLKDGLYFAGDGFDGDFYFVKVNETENRFTAESLGGFVKIDNYELFAKQLIKVADPHHNLEFALLKLSEILKT